MPAVARKFDPAKRWPTLVVLHGQESNSKQYLRKIETVWPELAERYILVGIDGERRSSFGNDQNPRHSYSFINFAGKSDKYRGFPGTDRESPALVAETLAELRNVLPTERVVLAGHLDGGTVALSVLMNYPETIDAAVLLSASVLVQCEPTGYTNKSLRELQRARPIAIVHSDSDPLVSKVIWDQFTSDNFNQIHSIEVPEGGSGFTNLALDEALNWLESKIF
jgi:predicted esterase